MQFFYHPHLFSDNIVLSAEESNHCAKALRKKPGEYIFITDGKGNLAKGKLLNRDWNACVIHLVGLQENYGVRKMELHLAISPTKNPDRMEWLVEKSIEIGVEKLTFIICEHSERPRLDLERMKRVGISALKQSNTTWLPYMEILSYRDFMIQHGDVQVHKFIAWCDDSNEKQLTDQLITMNKVMLLIGPEGDFSEEEIQLAKHYHFTEVKLGNRRLRTETAGLYGCCVLAGKAEEK